MPSFAEPQLDFPFKYKLNDELANLKQHLKKRNFPKKKSNKLILGSWNIANLGEQKRTLNDLKICAEIIKQFDLVAIQEVKNNLTDFTKIMSLLGDNYASVFTDIAGNLERLAFVYNKKKVMSTELKGEVVVLKREKKTLTFTTKKKIKNKPTKITKIKQRFEGFNRNPYIGSFSSGKFSFTLVNVHIYFGAPRGEKFRRRILEIYTLASWAHKRVTADDKAVFDKDIILLGDMNVPTRESDDKVFKRLVKFGMKPTTHGSAVGTNLNGKKSYDQITFLPSETKRFTEDSDVFDFDKGLFTKLWDKLDKQFENLSPKKKEKEQLKKYMEYVRFHISDHRPIWAVFKTD